MVYNRKDLIKALSPNKSKKFSKMHSPHRIVKPSTSGTTMRPKNESGAETSIKVIVRVRPPNDRENQDNYKIIVKVVDDKMLIFDPKEEENPFFYRGVVQKGRDLLKKQNKELDFIFDRVFDTTSTNEDVFEGSTKELISSLLNGYNCSVFAYGATGAGKTHTMLGKEEEPGITYRTMAELFAQIELQKEQLEFNLGVTYLEIYNENVQDLLHKSGPLHLRDDGRNGVRITGLKIITIDNADELFGLLTRGNRNRTQFATDANGESSRSHAVFQVYINMKNKLDGQVRCVKLSMIDLAGSERASVTGCKGDRFKEGANINKSLLALGNCINSLADGNKHVPYRDSKLTRLLKDSLGGNCQTVMIANVSPSSLCYEDTYNTLRYANRAKKIKTNVKKNIVSCQMHVTEYVKLIEELKKENAVLKSKLAGSDCTVKTGRDNTSSEDIQKLSKEYEGKLRDIWYKRKTLVEKILSLESMDKIICYRMSNKQRADERLCLLSATMTPVSEEEQNASGKSRLSKSMQYFKRQRDSLRMQMSSTWEELLKVEEENKILQRQIQERNLAPVLANFKALLQCELEKSLVQQQLEHSKKVGSLQKCEVESCNAIIKEMSGMLQNYYYMTRGQGNLTESMEKEFKKLIKDLEGIKNIKWLDASTKQEEEYHNMTNLNVQRLEDPLAAEPISILPYDIDDAVQENVNNLEKQNSTITLSEECATLETLEDVEVPRMNDTFNLDSNMTKVAKKRILVDQGNKGSSPAKQSKKVTSTTIAPSGKENQVKTNQQRAVISAKSAMIMNKLKTERLKKLPQLPPRSNVKITIKPKTTPVAPSTRVPW